MIDEDLLACNLIMNNIQGRIIRLKNRRNQLVLFRRLPAELVYSIFNAALLGSEEDAGHSMDHYERLRTLRLVCKYWESFIDGTPSFWTRVLPRQSARWVDFVLRRSRGLPVSISYDSWSPYARDPNVLLRIAKQGHRVKDFCLIDLEGHFSLSLLSPFFKSPAPLVETFELCHRASYLPGFHSEPIINLFEGQAPKLTSMYLDGASVDLSQFSLAALQVVQLRNLPSVWVSHLLAFFASSPNISDVRIEGGRCFPLSDSQATDQQPVNLNSLKHLELNDIGMDIMSQLFQHTCLPPTAVVRLRPARPHENPPAFKRLVDIVASCVTRESSLELSYEEELHIKCKEYHIDGGWGWEAQYALAQAGRNFEGFFDDAVSLPVRKSISLLRLKLDDVQQRSHMTRAESEMVCDIIDRAFPSLRELQLVNIPSDFCWKALSLRPQRHDAEPVWVRTFKSVTAFSFEGVTLWKPAIRGIAMVVNGRSAPFIEDQDLEPRVRQNVDAVPIQKLVVSGDSEPGEFEGYFVDETFADDFFQILDQVPTLSVEQS